MSMFSKRKALTGIIAGFQKTIRELDAFMAQADSRQKEIEGEVNKLNVEKSDLVEDWNQADTVKANLKALVGDVKS